MRELRLWRKERQLIDKLDSHQAKVIECVEKLIEALPEVIEGNREKTHEVRAEVRRLEREADRIARELEKDLSQRSIKRSDREDLLRLIFHFEAIADHAEAAADELHTVKFNFLEDPIRKSLIKFSKCVLDAARQLLEASRMFEKNNEAVIELGDRVSEYEEEADEERRRLMDIISSKEPDLTIWQFFSFNKLISSLENIADTAEDAANTLRTIAIARL